MSRLLIVSNRLPVNIETENEKPVVKSSSGGLVSAMNSFLNAVKDKTEFTEVLWIGCPGCSAKNWKHIKNEIDETSYRYIPVFINQRIYNGYYNGFSNSTLWPLFHYFPSLTEYEKQDYEDYKSANQAFADVIIKEMRETDLVWIHDYQLLLLPGLLRLHDRKVAIGFFLHIPFPSHELFRMLPKEWRESLLKGILGSDLVGFHTNDYVMHFLKSVQLITGYENEMRLINTENRSVKAEVFPISIDFQKYYNGYDDPGVVLIRDQLHEKFKGQKIIFSVDRLDYTKGVIDRLKAYDHFLATNPAYRERVVFVLVVVPSRDMIVKYSERKKSINELIGFLNGKYSSLHWQPVIYRYASLAFEELLALYSGCDLALITPIRDGMNLVSKEFIASRKDERGVLILSEMAGAASELGEALIINPFDMEDIARRIRQALDMQPLEQSIRMKTMQQRIRNYDVTRWATDFLYQLKDMKRKQEQFIVTYLNEQDREQLRDEYADARRRLLLLDYDGTLVKFSSHPLQAAPTPDVLVTLEQLSHVEQNDIYVISGRDAITLEKWFGHLPVGWVAEHGAILKMKGKPAVRKLEINNGWKIKAMEILQSYVLRCPQTFIEEKEYSIVWHFRNADKELGSLRSKELFTELNDVFKNLNFHVITGNKVIEIRMRGADKGTAVKEILAQYNYDFILSVGDDRTDEDMFKVLENENAWTIRIGRHSSAAKYNLPSTAVALELLSDLCKIPVAGDG